MADNAIRIPTHIIAGPLGVGKTTAILDLLKRQRDGSHAAVLVNDFGSVGLDSALIDAEGQAVEDKPLHVQSIPGGCICCTAAAGLTQALKKVLELPQVDRVIVEPSGVVATGQLVDVLQHVSRDDRIDIRPIVVLVDPVKMTGDLVAQMPYYSRLVEAADVLVANRCDLADDQAMADFQQWSSKLYPPPMRIIETTQGQLPQDILGLERERPWKHVNDASTTDHHSHHHHEHNATHIGGGFLWPPGVVFDDSRLMRVVESLVDLFAEGRFKAVFHSSAGWLYIDIADGRVNRRITEYRRDSRVDWILPATCEDQWDDDALKAQLETAKLGDG